MLSFTYTNYVEKGKQIMGRATIARRKTNSKINEEPKMHMKVITRSLGEEVIWEVKVQSLRIIRKKTKCVISDRVCAASMQIG